MNQAWSIGVRPERTLRLPWILRVLQPLDFPHKLGLMDRAFGTWLARQGTVWVQTAAGLPWKLDLSYAPGRWIVYGKYEGGAFLDWARHFLRPTSIVVDGGANIGQMVLYLAQWVPDGKVLAFEPGRYQSDWLRECLRCNPQLPVEVLSVGLGDRLRDAYLRQCSPRHAHGAWSQVSDDEGEEIRLVRLADFLAQRNLDHIDLWKLDVEGFELPALRGAEDLLRSRKISALYVELSGTNGEDVRKYLAGLGYRCYLFTKAGNLVPATQLPQHTNGLFLPA